MRERDRTQHRTDWDDDFGGRRYDRYEERGGYEERGYGDESGANGDRDWQYRDDAYGTDDDRAYGRRSESYDDRRYGYGDARTGRTGYGGYGGSYGGYGRYGGPGPGRGATGPGGYRRGGYGEYGRYDPYPGYDPYGPRDAGKRFGGGRSMGERGYGQSRAGRGGYGRGGYGGGSGERTQDREGGDSRRFERQEPWRDRERGFGDREASFTEPTDVYNYWEVMWWRPGEFTGRGPRGYRRSDERITEDVSDRLEQSGAIDASDIEVHVKDGKVTLEGKVDDKDQKRMAEDLVEACPGVREVDNRLKVKRSLVGVFGGDKGRDDDERTSRAPRTRAGSTSGSGPGSSSDITAGTTAGSKTGSNSRASSSS